MNIKVYIGANTKSVFENGICYYYFSCKDNDDVNTIYDDLAENIKLKDPDTDFINLHYLKDDNVKSLLQDAKKQGFILDYEIVVPDFGTNAS